MPAPYLFAAESLAYMSASILWWRVWKCRSPRALDIAALCTACCLALTAFRIALTIVLGEHA